MLLATSSLIIVILMGSIWSPLFLKSIPQLPPGVSALSAALSPVGGSSPAYIFIYQTTLITVQSPTTNLCTATQSFKNTEIAVLNPAQPSTCCFPLSKFPPIHIINTTHKPVIELTIRTSIGGRGRSSAVAYEVHNNRTSSNGDTKYFISSIWLLMCYCAATSLQLTSYAKTELKNRPAGPTFLSF